MLLIGIISLIGTISLYKFITLLNKLIISLISSLSAIKFNKDLSCKDGKNNQHNYMKPICGHMICKKCGVKSKYINNIGHNYQIINKNITSVAIITTLICISCKNVETNSQLI